MPTTSARRTQAFLDTFDRECQTTLKVLRAYPEDKLDLKPSDKSKTARELAWVFAAECGLGAHVWNDALANGMPAGGGPPAPPAKWSDLVAGVEKALADYRSLVAAASDEDLDRNVHFFTAPKTMGQMSRHQFIWFLLHDHIHHRGQFSVYLRMAGGKLPSIYGPTADEPWM